MFFMVLRVAKLLVDSNTMMLSSARAITRALIAGVGRVSIVFFILIFAMIFFGVLGHFLSAPLFASDSSRARFYPRIQS
jgi:hypothetical protein